MVEVVVGIREVGGEADRGKEIEKGFFPFFFFFAHAEFGNDIMRVYD